MWKMPWLMQPGHRRMRGVRWGARRARSARSAGPHRGAPAAAKPLLSHVKKVLTAGSGHVVRDTVNNRRPVVFETMGGMPDGGRPWALGESGALFLRLEAQRASLA